MLKHRDECRDRTCIGREAFSLLFASANDQPLVDSSACEFRSVKKLSGKISELAMLVEGGDEQTDIIAGITRFVADSPTSLRSPVPRPLGAVEAE